MGYKKRNENIKSRKTSGDNDKSYDGYGEGDECGGVGGDYGVH